MRAFISKETEPKGLNFHEIGNNISNTKLLAENPLNELAIHYCLYIIFFCISLDIFISKFCNG